MIGQVVLTTNEFDADFRDLTTEHGFRVDAIFPADAPHTAVVSGHGITIRLEQHEQGRPIDLRLLTDPPRGPISLAGGSTIRFPAISTSFDLPANEPRLVVSA
jgi:hypothetical protein